MIKVLDTTGVVIKIEANKNSLKPYVNNKIKWELFFDEKNEFRGVKIDELTDEQLEDIIKDCFSRKGFYEPSLFNKVSNL